VAFSKIIAESMDLSDSYNFTGTLQQNGAGIGGNNKPNFFANHTASGGQSIPGSTMTVVNFTNEVFDTDNAYDGTNKFTPQTAGKYYLEALIRLPSTTDLDNFQILIYKNTDAVAFVNEMHFHYESRQVSCIVQANGSSDYFQVRCFQGSGGSLSLSESTNDGRNYFAGFKLIE
tara:strand:- start:56 stop:577 length:522 start_codon:yes stop_codon:yes gene_type:complete